MSYGKSWEKYPIKEGEIWGNSRCSISAHDITRDVPDFMNGGDMIYSDTPWTLQNVNMFNKKAGRDYMYDFAEFYLPLFRHIKTINPKTCFLEIGKQSLGLFKTELIKIFDVVQVWPITYYDKHPCFLLRGADCSTVKDYSGMDDTITPLEAITTEKPLKVIDFCTGRGITGLAAISCNCSFAGTELNSRKLAVFIDRANKKGYGIQKII